MPVLLGWNYSREADAASAEIYSRLEFRFDSSIDYHHFTLDNPHRVVIDFSGEIKIPSAKEIADGIIKRVRFGRPRPGILRVVLDLERKYPYRLQVKHAPFRLTVRISRTFLHVWHTDKIIPMELEEYLAGVVAGEMPASFHAQALSAQAVAARTYTARRMLVFGGSGCERAEGADVCSDAAHCQSWLPLAEMKSRWGQDYMLYREKITQAVRDTQWQVLYYRNGYADAVYHSTCGGMTEDAEAVWGTSVPYLKTVPCSYDKHSPFYEQKHRVPVAELAEKTGTDFEGVQPFFAGKELLFREDMSIAQTLRKIMVGGKSLSGFEFRRLFGLPSQWLDWSVKEVEIISRGFGHRVGLCQYGADGMAKGGADWQEILSHYYRGTEISTLEKEAVTPAPPPPLTGIIIALDPGHGGTSSGAVGPSGLKEKDVVLEIALRAAAKLQKKGAVIVLTREDDSTVTLQKRVEVSNDAKANLFVSIHANGHENELANGTETYYYPGSIQGRLLAEAIQQEMLASLGRRDRGVKTAAFYVIRYTLMPAVLAEAAFITNREEERLLADPIFRQKAADAIVAGIMRYLGK